MNRRKFLNVGGISILGLNGIWSAVSSRYQTGRGSVLESFISGLGVSENLDYNVEKNPVSDCEELKKLLQLGYQYKKKPCYAKGNFTFLALELLNNDKICDEILLSFYGSHLKFTGTINARQMGWFIQQYPYLETLALQQGCEIADLIIPDTSSRTFEQGLAFYPTKEGIVGFKTELIHNDVKIHGVLKNTDRQTLIEETFQSTFYPNIFTLQTLV